MPRADSPYNAAYEARRRAALASSPACQLRLKCAGDAATSLDHDPPLASHDHVEGSGCCVERPACGPCQTYQGGLLSSGQSHLLERRIPEPSRNWP